jgi:hypothetical protein
MDMSRIECCLVYEWQVEQAMEKAPFVTTHKPNIADCGPVVRITYALLMPHLQLGNLKGL